MTEFLKVTSLRAGYGEINVLWGVDFTIKKGDITALIGSNGAGKSTLMRTLSGLIAPTEGEILFEGASIGKETPAQILARGIAHVPEGRRLFGAMSVEENLMMGAYTRDDTAGIKTDIDRMFETFPRLKERATQLAGTMSGGEQQMLAMARALMSRPRLLLLDEPSMGLSPIMVAKIFEVIRAVSASGTTLLLVEQNARLALEAADRCYVMDSGLITMTGDAASMLNDPRVRAAYLGEAA